MKAVKANDVIAGASGGMVKATPDPGMPRIALVIALPCLLLLWSCGGTSVKQREAQQEAVQAHRLEQAKAAQERDSLFKESVAKRLAAGERPPDVPINMTISVAQVGSSQLLSAVLPGSASDAKLVAMHSRDRIPDLPIVRCLMGQGQIDLVDFSGSPVSLASVSRITNKAAICGNSELGRVMIGRRTWYCRDMPDKECITSEWFDGHPVWGHYLIGGVFQVNNIRVEPW